jgi:hypothetical protein
MEELLDWLHRQSTSVRMFSQFCEKAHALRTTEPEHAAMARLLANLAGNFSEAYYSQPLTLDVAERALARLTELVDKAVRANADGPQQQIALLNELGRTDLN